MSTDTNALVGKLRYMGRQYAAGQVSRGGSPGKHYLEEAADTIERLARERDEAVARERERCAALVEGRAGPMRTGAYEALIAAADAIRTTEATT